MTGDFMVEFRKKIHQKTNVVEVDDDLPVLPKDILKWIETARPVVDGLARNFLYIPFWVPIYNDYSWDAMVVAGRQVFKSTYCTDLLAYGATTQPSAEICYVTHDEASLAAFSTQRVQEGTFRQNPMLRAFPKHGVGAVQKIQMKNGSVIYLVSDSRRYSKVEGKTLSWCVCDEAQYQAMEHMPVLREALRVKKARLRIVGIGGESGSSYEREWRKTTQSEWKFRTEAWREKLDFNDEGLIIGEYMTDLLQGYWEPQNRDAVSYSGYHIPQTIIPTIPLTIEEALTKYKVRASDSIEWKRKEYPASYFQTHVMGLFHKSARRPVTREMVLACMTPYPKYGFLTPDDVRELKETFGDELVVSLGIDWGSGPSASYTVVTILLRWKKSNRIQIAYMERRPQENGLDQAKYMTNLFKAYRCDFGVADLGYGREAVKIMQHGGSDRLTGELFNGVGDDKLLGCLTGSNPAKALQYHESITDTHGDTVSRMSVDHEFAIDMAIDVLTKMITHPTYQYKTQYARPQLMIPNNSFAQTKLDFLINDFTTITRKDMAIVEDVDTVDSRISPKKQYNHPKDSVMSLIYALIASSQYDGSQWSYISARNVA